MCWPVLLDAVWLLTVLIWFFNWLWVERFFPQAQWVDSIEGRRSLYKDEIAPSESEAGYFLDTILSLRLFGELVWKFEAMFLRISDHFSITSDDPVHPALDYSDHISSIPFTRSFPTTGNWPSLEFPSPQIPLYCQRGNLMKSGILDVEVGCWRIKESRAALGGIFCKSPMLFCASSSVNVANFRWGSLVRIVKKARYRHPAIRKNEPFLMRRVPSQCTSTSSCATIVSHSR